MEETNENSRSVIIGAIVLAALVAGGLWYAFVFRGADNSEFATNSPTIDEDSATLEADIYATQVPTSSATPTMLVDSGYTSVTEVTETPVSDVAGVMTVGATAKTGPGELVLALSLAGIVGGTFGLRRIRHK